MPGPVRTSLDLPLQLTLEAEVRHTVETLSDRGASQAAAVVLDNATGEVLAWVGSPDFWADTAGQVDMVTSPRQPGSALKPFLYALAFDRGYTPASILPDIARVYQTSTGPYHPRNYDRRFHGPVRAREALASSYNLPAVDLASRVGIGSLLHVLHEAGFASLGRSAEYYGLGLSLGNGDVTLLELANGYRALANGGVWRPWRWRAAEPGEPAEPGRRIATARSAALVLDILDDPVARVPGFGVETPLDFPFPVAAKTGTSRHFTDNWAVGAAGGFTVAVWVGNFSGRPMDGVSGVSGAGPLLHRAVLATAGRHPPGALPTPQAAGAVPVLICRLSGLRATPQCPSAVEWFAPRHRARAAVRLAPRDRGRVAGGIRGVGARKRGRSDGGRPTDDPAGNRTWAGIAGRRRQLPDPLTPGGRRLPRAAGGGGALRDPGPSGRGRRRRAGGALARGRTGARRSAVAAGSGPPPLPGDGRQRPDGGGDGAGGMTVGSRGAGRVEKVIHRWPGRRAFRGLTTEARRRQRTQGQGYG